MSKNFEQNFSLKDWVTKRAANMPEAMEEETVLQVQNGADIVMRHEKLRMTDVPEEKTPETDEKQHQMTARISSSISNAASAPSVPASPAQQIQIVRLLRDLGDRLRQSEKEREILWRELDSCRKLLTDIEDKTSKTEKAYLSIENKLNAPQEVVVATDTEEAKEFRKTIENKISALETTTGSAVLRLEDAISENAKLTRRLEQVTQDRVQLINKIEEMQETLAETQDTLRAKALVLLTDHALANKTGLPQAKAWSGNDTLRTQEAPAPATEDFGIENQPWWKNQTAKKMSMSKTALVSLVVLGVAGGWAVTKIGVPSSLDFLAPAKIVAPAPVVATPAPVVKPAAPVEDKSSAADQKYMNDMAKIANQIEPGAPDETAEAAPAPATPVNTEENLQGEAQTLAMAAEAKAKDAFAAERPAGNLAQRIQKDATLPVQVKAIENKAFAGDAEAQHDLAAVYTAGHAGVKTNYTKAATWFTEAAHSGISNAQYNLAVLYHQGLGVKQDTKKAIDLYRIAASSNHPEAEYNLGIAHIEGIGADYNPQIAAYYFQKAAQGGVIEAAYNMGLIEENGLLGEAQPGEALFWYKLAANRGNSQAKEALAQLTKQMNMTPAQADESFKRVSAEKAEIAKGLTAPVAAEVKPVATKAPVSLAPPAPAPAKVAAAPKPAPVAIGAPAYDPVIVAQIQEQLIRLGLYSGSADGTADKSTQDAVRSYQSANKIKIDGKPTEDVLVHMLASDLQSEPASGK